MLRSLDISDATLIEDAALAVAALEYADLHIMTYQKKLDRLAAKLSGRMSRTTGIERAHLLGTFVLQESGFRPSAAYDDPKTNFLNEVLDRRVASPVAMSILLMAIGRRVGLEVEGIPFPEHFLVRIDGSYFDPFLGGPLPPAPLMQRAMNVLKETRAAILSLQPIKTKKIIERMLRNLLTAYAKTGDHIRAFAMKTRLYDLTQDPVYGAPVPQEQRN